MKELIKILKDYSIAEKRSSLYYLGRYIKQAEAFEEYKKDIFEDDPNSIPSEAIKTLTLNMIEIIELSAKKKASQFNDDEYIYWMDRIAEIEDSIDPEPSDEQMKNALENLSKFDTPDTTNIS